jgi:hypothetical protein
LADQWFLAMCVLSLGWLRSAAAGSLPGCGRRGVLAEQRDLRSESWTVRTGTLPLKPVMPELDSLRGIALLLVWFFDGFNYPGLVWSQFKGPGSTVEISQLPRASPNSRGRQIPGDSATSSEAAGGTGARSGWNERLCSKL